MDLVASLAPSVSSVLSPSWSTSSSIRWDPRPWMAGKTMTFWQSFGLKHSWNPQIAIGWRPWQCKEDEELKGEKRVVGGCENAKRCNSGCH